VSQERPNLGIAIRKALVDVLVVAGFADDRSIRTLMVAELRTALEHPFTFSDQLAGRDQLIEIVNTCCRLGDGLTVLAEVLAFLRPGTKECEEVRNLVSSIRMHEVVPVADQEKLRRRLTGFAPSSLDAAVRRAARHVVPPPRYDDASDALAGLADFNAAPGELPPVLIFVELIAAECDGILAAELRAWGDGQARRLRLGDALQELRKEVAEPFLVSGRVHLVIVFSPDAIDTGLYQLSCWRQSDPHEWPPACGETLAAQEHELEERVSALVIEAERSWSDDTADVVLEFVLPRSLLNLPVHSWLTERASGSPRPLYLGYPTVIRSLERMVSRQWHRVWRRRWEVWTRDPSFERVYFCQVDDTRDQHRLEAILSDEQWVMTVLTGSPPPDPVPGRDELLSALRAGVPVIAWHPVAPSEVLREVVAWLADGSGGLGDLPARTRKSRLDLLQNPVGSSDIDAIADLVVLWDDPNRLLPLGETRTIGHPEGGADERDRAS
jgi:hypothetical protein